MLIGLLLMTLQEPVPQVPSDGLSQQGIEAQAALVSAMFETASVKLAEALGQFEALRSDKNDELKDHSAVLRDATEASKQLVDEMEALLAMIPL